MRIMTKEILKKHYNSSNYDDIVCVSCGTIILLGEKFDTFKGRLRKYCCKKCSKKEVIVFQYPTRRIVNTVKKGK